MTTARTLTLSDAKAMVAAAQGHAAELGIAYSIAVVDSGGHLLHFERGDGGVAGCAELAINKAFTAVMFGQGTEVLASLAQPGAPLYGIQHALAGRAVVFGGGLPVHRAGQLVGAVGASAGTIEQDLAVGQAALLAMTEAAA